MFDKLINTIIGRSNESSVRLIEDAIYKSLSNVCGNIPKPVEIRNYGGFHPCRIGLENYDVFTFKGKELFRVYRVRTESSLEIKIDFLYKPEDCLVK